MINEFNLGLFDGVEELEDIRAIYHCMEANCPRPQSSSRKLWELRRAVSISPHNTSAETMLEKSVANLAHNGRMPGWFNQCPTASGIGDSSRYKHRNVDLVHWSQADGTARLVELKWESDDPRKALRQILVYGATYVFCRIHRAELPLKDRPLMAARHISLEVTAPARYFRGSGFEAYLDRMRETIERFDLGSRLPGLSMSLDALAFPDDFDALPFADGGEVRKFCDGEHWTGPAHRVRDAFDNLAPPRSALRERRRGWGIARWLGLGRATTPGSPRVRQSWTSPVGKTMSGRFLPGVPAAEVEAAFAAAPGNEIISGKFDSPESSAALAANTFGFFLNRPQGLPPLLGCEREVWPALGLMLEAEVRFPWRGGRHPVLDCLVATSSALIGIESKRYEPFRDKKTDRRRSPSRTYWRPCWGRRMAGYERVRDALRADPWAYASLDAAQLFKHAFALRTEVHRAGPHAGLRPILFYLYAEPETWPKDGRRVAEDRKAQHRQEIDAFAATVAGDEVSFVACSYSALLRSWANSENPEIQAHADRVIERYAP